MHLEITFYNLKVIKHNTNVKYKHVRIQKVFQGDVSGDNCVMESDPFSEVFR